MPKGSMHEALQECAAYNKVGALDESMIRDIAHDFRIDPEALKKEWYGEE